MADLRRQIPKVDLSKLPSPHSVEAEEWVLGAVFHDDAALDAVAAIIGPKDFSSPAREIVFTALLELARRQVPLTLVTVANQLEALDRLVEVGGAAFLAELVERCPTAANVVHHARIVKQHAIRRDVMRRAAEIATTVAHDARPLPDYLPEMLAPLASLPLAPIEPQPLGQIVVDAMVSIEAVQERRIQPAMTTGWSGLDQVLGGWFPGYVVAAARTSVGKSSFALAAALTAAAKGERADYFSLELPSELMVKRSLAQLSGISLKDILRGSWSRDDKPKLDAAADRLSQLPLTFHEDWQRLWPNVQTQIRRAVLGEGSKLIVLDYLGLLRMPDGKGRSPDRRDIIGGISHDLKALANFLKVPIIVPVQINREVGKEKDHRPKIWMLRDSGDIEQDAGVVLLLHRPALYDAQDPEELCEVIVAKQSNGPLGKCELYFNAGPMSFHDWDQRPEALRRVQDQFRYEGAA